MHRTCDWCRIPIAFLEAQTSSDDVAWHTRCWNQATTELNTALAEFDNAEGFQFRPLPDELAQSETGLCRSEVIEMASQASETDKRTTNEIVRFPVNTPVEVTLQSEAGKHVEGRYGDQVMYSLLGDRIMYVPPYVEQRFQELAIGAGEPLLLCKRQVQVGNRNRIEWSVRRAPEQPSAPTNGTIALGACIPDKPLDLHTVNGKAGSNGNGSPTPHQAASPVLEETRPQVVKGVNGGSNCVVRQEEQPRGNSTALTAQESAVQTNHQHQRQDSAPISGTEIVLASAAAARPVEFSTRDRLFLPAMSLEVALARRAAIVEFTRRIMVKDQDFGVIPGACKPTLLKPGAEKLCNFFGLEPEFTPMVEEIDWTGAQHGGEVFCYARYRCRLLREGRTVGVGEGSCNSWEAKYRYRWVTEDQVPGYLDRKQLAKREAHRTVWEFEFAIDRAETSGTYGKPAEHWQRFREAIQAKTARSVEKLTRRGKSVAWEMDVDTTLYRIPNPDVADVVNTIQKMAQKRALVAATLIATSASEFFTQDVEDADPDGRSIDTGRHSKGTREAQEYVRDRKLEELRKPAGSEESQGGRPWKNFGEMRRMFEQLREQVEETRYLEEMALAGVQNPGQFQSASQALDCYRRLARIAAQPEVA